MTQGLRDEEVRKDVFEAMQNNRPFATYKKTILGRVMLKTLEPIRLIQEDIILSGDPEKNDEKCFYKAWSQSEEKYLRRNNAWHFEKGTIIPYTKDEEQRDLVNQISDEEIESILRQPHFALKNAIDKFTSTVPVMRFLLAAERLNRPMRTIEYIKERLSRMEGAPTPNPAGPTEVTRIDINK